MPTGQHTSFVTTVGPSRRFHRLICKRASHLASHMNSYCGRAAGCAILSQVRNALARLRRTLVTILPPSAPNESVRWLSFRYVTNLISSHSRHSSRHAILPMQTLASPLPSCCAKPSKINTLKPYAALAATSGTCGCPQPMCYPIRCGRGLANSFDALPWRLRAPTTRRPLTTTVVQRRTGCRPSVVA